MLNVFTNGKYWIDHCYEKKMYWYIKMINAWKDRKRKERLQVLDGIMEKVIYPETKRLPMIG